MNAFQRILTTHLTLPYLIYTSLWNIEFSSNWSLFFIQVSIIPNEPLFNFWHWWKSHFLFTSNSEKKLIMGKEESSLLHFLANSFSKSENWLGQDFSICSSLQQVKHDFIIAYSQLSLCVAQTGQKNAYALKFLFAWNRDWEDGSSSQHNLKECEMQAGRQA